MRNKLIGGILAMLLLAVLPAAAFAQVSVGVSVNVAPPPLPVYTQPPAPDAGYIWTPGYWAWDDSYGDYYWVPGTWVMAPQPGFLWTPGYWGWNDGAYAWHPGYWGPQVGFYGGVNYGFGYSGNGYGGGYWRGNQFYYNRSVNNISNTNITNVYNAPVPRGSGDSHVSYNGGQGGVRAEPTPQQRAEASRHHVGPTAAQIQQEHAASGNQQLRASVNHGKPAVAATARPGEFSGKDVVAAVAAGGVVHATARPQAAHGARPQPAQQRAEQERSAQSAQAERQRADQQRSVQAEQRQRAEQQQSRIREARAPSRAPESRERAPAPRASEQGGNSRREAPKPKQAPKPAEEQGPHGG
jgi:WXXGXW repeat (2 copies)